MIPGVMTINFVTIQMVNCAFFCIVCIMPKQFPLFFIFFFFNLTSIEKKMYRHRSSWENEKEIKMLGHQKTGYIMFHVATYYTIIRMSIPIDIPSTPSHHNMRCPAYA